MEITQDALNHLEKQPELANLLLFAPELPDLLQKRYSDTCHAKRNPHNYKFDIFAALQVARGVLNRIYSDPKYDKNQLVIGVLATTKLVVECQNGYVLTAQGLLCQRETPSIGKVSK